MIHFYSCSVSCFTSKCNDFNSRSFKRLKFFMVLGGQILVFCELLGRIQAVAKLLTVYFLFPEGNKVHNFLCHFYATAAISSVVFH